jgi:diamine N-acetyltransferase
VDEWRRNVLLETLEWNIAGLTAYERAGFRRLGVRCGAVMSRGRPTDLAIMDAAPEDFGASCSAEQPAGARACPRSV